MSSTAEFAISCQYELECLENYINVIFKTITAVAYYRDQCRRSDGISANLVPHSNGVKV